MDLIIHNTLTRKKEVFRTIFDERVGVYYCGPTVYWRQHIGNLRGGACADLIVRALRYNNYNPLFVRNYTDVGHLVSDEDTGEDKMERAAKRENLSPEAIALKYINQYEKDTEALNFLEPTVKPRATKHIQEMQAMVQELLSKGFAYSTDLAINFDVSKAVNYNRLSHQNLEKNISGAGQGETADPQKRSPADFVLWFFRAGVHKNALQYWPSPWRSPLAPNGAGFPGWHIECSAMSKKYLGATADIHLGGVEHIPVHHTNEIAQSESANGVRSVNYWLHNEHLVVDGQKMAKSSGTNYVLSDITDRGFDPLALRYFFLQAHYRSRLNFTWEALEQAVVSFKKIRRQMNAFSHFKTGRVLETYRRDFQGAINDDFNAPQALAVLWAVLRDVKTNEADKLATILDFDKVLGLDLAKPLPVKPIPDAMTRLLEQRNEARAVQDWKRADRIRNQLKKLGYKINDSESESEFLKL